VPTTFVWSSDTPDMATVDQFGVITALAVGTAVFRATAADGTTGTWPLPTRVGVASATASYAGNTEFGEPADADPSDDFIVRHAEYTTDYNPNRGEPNWVSYDIDASAFGDEDRCNCFTFDPDLPASFTHLTTQDYTGAGAAAGFSIDRGHMTRSFDRTTSSLDNAHTFMLSNVVPQASDLNQGPWALFEDFLGDLAMNHNKEVRIITGPAGNQGTVKNEGKIVIPTSTWKVAVIMDRGHGLADIRDYRDVEVIAVNMPNMAGVRNVPWQTYLTTVDAIEALTGYDLLARLPDKVENIVEAGIKPPIAAIDGPYAGSEGGSIAMSAAASVDPNGTVVSYAWDFGDGTTGTGPSVAHTYAKGGVYTVTITVTDNDNLSDTIQTVATVANVPPIAALDGPYTGAEGSAIAMSAAASRDPNGTVVSYAWDFGDGTKGTGPTALHTYAQDSVYTVTVTVTDNDGHTDTTQAIAMVTNVAPAIAPFAGATLLPGESYAASGSFTDPGMDPWTATVDYGDGSGATPLALSGMGFALAHTYGSAGVFTVTVSVSDDHVTTTATQTVTVTSQAQAVRNVIALVELLSVSGEIRRNVAILLDAQLEVAASALDVHQPIVALAVLDAVLIELDVFARLRQIPMTDAQLLRAAINRIVTSIAATSGIQH
jgi:DNA/RNA endonuclease G (NUC1)/PKD repeat protein